MNSFSEDSRRAKVDKYLKENYGFGLEWFHYCLSRASTFCNLRRKKKNLSKYRRRLQYLESFKEGILKQLEEIMSKTGLIKNIEMKRKYKKSGLTQEQRHEEIIKLFNLEPIFKRAEEKIRQTKRRIALLNAFYKEPIKTMTTIDRRKSIDPTTVVALAWLKAMRGPRKQRHYRDVETLLKWFSKNHQDEITKNFGRLLYISESAVRRANERYIKHPNRRQKIYGELVTEFFDSSIENHS